MNEPKRTTDARDLANRYLALWEEYLTALIADPAAAAPWGFPADAGSDPGRGSDDDRNRESGPAARAASVPGASGECDRLVADLARRLADLEQRVAAAERSERAAKRARRRDSTRSGLTMSLAALDDEIVRRAEAYVGGIEAYRRHSFRRTETRARVLWREGATRLLDYGRDGAGIGVLVVPSLINRYFVLDLLPERSFLHHLAGQGLRPFVVDWGVPGVDEDAFDLTAYIVNVSIGCSPLVRTERGVRSRFWAIAWAGYSHWPWHSRRRL